MEQVKIVNKEVDAVSRRGKIINMEDYLGELDSFYLSLLDASVAVSKTVDRFSDNSWEDYYRVKLCLKTLTDLDYLTQEEYEAMVQTASIIRDNYLTEFKNRVTENKED